MTRLRDDQALFDKVLNLIGESWNSASDRTQTGIILDAVDRHLASATPPQIGHRGTPGEAVTVVTACCGMAVAQTNQTGDVFLYVCPVHGTAKPGRAPLTPGSAEPLNALCAAPPGSAVAGAPRPVLPWPTLLEDLDEAADWWQECGRHSDAARLRRRATLIRARFENWEIAKSSRLPLGPESAHAMLVVTAVNEEDPRPPAAPPGSAAKGPTK